MVDKKLSAVAARRQARERLARERAEQAERNRRNEDDLIDFLMVEQQIAAADVDRDAAIKSAQERHRTVVEKLKQRQAACLTRMSDRGESSAIIADRTGLTVREVKHRLVRRTAGAQPDEMSSETTVERPGRRPSANVRSGCRDSDVNREELVRGAALVPKDDRAAVEERDQVRAQSELR